MKECSKCKKILPNTQFSKLTRLKSGLYSQCKECVSEYTKEYRRKDRSDRKRRDRLKASYGLTPEDVDQMYIGQGGKCLICGVHKNTYNTAGGLYIDHCHKTGKVRGLLCVNCNVLLGRAKDNVDLLTSAINYLEVNK